jgi:molybdopterin synthase catalytic subunit
MIDEALARFRHPRRARGAPRGPAAGRRPDRAGGRQSAHRGQAFQACEFLMDYLKTQAPFWKKETTPEGARWVDARVADDAGAGALGHRAGNAGGRG